MEGTAGEGKEGKKKYRKRKKEKDFEKLCLDCSQMCFSRLTAKCKTRISKRARSHLGAWGRGRTSAFLMATYATATKLNFFNSLNLPDLSGMDLKLTVYLHI